METKKGRLLAAVLVLAVAVNLTACKDKAPAPEDLAFQAAPGYLQEDITLPVNTGELIGTCTDNESVWFWTTHERGALPSIWQVPLDGTDAELLAEYEPWEVNEKDNMGYIGPVLGGDGTLWIWEQKIAHGSSSTDETFQMRQLDPGSGKTLKTLDITDTMQVLDTMTLNGIAADAGGTLYLADKKQIAAIDDEGQIAYTIKAKLTGGSIPENAGGMLALLADGTIGALTVQSEKKRAVCRIDAENRTLEDKQYAVPSSVNEIYPGQGKCLFYYTNNDALFGVVEGEDLPQRLLPWYNTQVESADEVKLFALMEDSKAAFLTWDCSSIFSDERYDGQIRVMRLQPTDEPPKEDRTRLVYGTIGEREDMRYEIIKFNRLCKDYYIEIRDYSEGMVSYWEKDSPLYQSALARLFVDIAAGEGPDILGDGLPLETLGRQGALENLWPYIDNDPDLGREAVMEHVLECMETGDGELYRLCRNFTIETAAASVERAGNRTGWTMDEMLAAYGGELPDIYFVNSTDMGNEKSSWKAPYFNKIDKNATLRYLVNRSVDSYIDWESGECSFDSDDFKALLRLTDTTSGLDTELDTSEYWMTRDLSRMGVQTHEMVQLLPWEGAPVLYARQLARAADLVLDDPLFSGRDALDESHNQRLWDAGLYQTAVVEQGEHAGWQYTTGNKDIDYKEILGDISLFNGGSEAYGIIAAADMVMGRADGQVYASYVGFPSSDGSGSNFTVYGCEAISATSSVKEGAWEFIRRLLLPGGNVDMLNEKYGIYATENFPMNRSDFESLLEPQYFTHLSTGELFYDTDGNPIERHSVMEIGYPGPIVEMVYLMSPSEEQLERFWNLYNSISHVTGENDEILDLIIEQAQPYFAGDKSLDETANLIQNRVQLYVHENM